MKKLFLICSLVMAILLGGISVDAKTTTKRQATKTHQSSKKSQNSNLPKEFGPSVFFKKDGEYKRDFEKTLPSLGFKKQSKSKWTKDGFTVDTSGETSIIFPNKEALNKFTKEMVESNIANETSDNSLETSYGILCYIEGLEMTIQILP